MEKQLKSFRRNLRRAFVVPLVLAAFLGGTFLVQTYALRSSTREVERSYTVQLRSRSLMRYIVDMETGLRGFLLTGEDHFLQPYRSAEPQIEPVLRELQESTVGEPTEQRLLVQIASDYRQWHAYAERMIQLRRQSGVITDHQLNLEGQEVMDGIRLKRDQLAAEEEDRLQAKLYDLRRTMRENIATAVLLSLILGLLLATFSRHELHTVAGRYVNALTAAEARREELHENQRWLTAVLGSIGDGVLATDGQGRVIFTNPVAEQILGLPHDRIIGSTTRELLHVVDENTREPRPDVFQAVMHKFPGPLDRDHHVLIRHDGTELPISDTASPIRDGEKTMGVVIMLRDLTHQRQSERALQSTEKLASIGLLTASVAHEIHNPLDAMSNLFYLLEHREGLDETTLQYLRLAHEELERVTSISEQMLNFSREARKPLSVNLENAIQNVLTLYSPRIRRQHIQVVTNYGESLTVFALPGELRQVFSNLIGNALDAMRDQGRLVITARSSLDTRDLQTPGVTVMVCDSGSGIPENIRPALMRPFATTKGEKGTGLGLWVCENIVNRYGGTLRYRSSTRPGHSGTCFRIFFPAEEARGSAPLSQLHQERA